MLQNLFLITTLVMTHITFSAQEFKARHTWKESGETVTITIDYDLKKAEAILKDSIHFSVDTPALQIIDWKSTNPAVTVYDVSHLAESLAYTGHGTFVVTLQRETSSLVHTPMPEQVHVFMHYQEKTTDVPQEFHYEFSIQEPHTSPQQAVEETKTVPHHLTKKNSSEQQQTSVLDWFSKKLLSLSNLISHFIQTSNSPIVRIVMIYILGLLMSLTPCIYPMIPITVGILQTTAQTSLFRNFLLAGSYTMGIATTFAMLGLLAAFGGSAFGSIMGNIYFVLFLVTFLAYLAFSMLGFYDMYVPRFMQPTGNHAVNGSYLSAFTFGAISGSAASPCLSPGLGLVFSIVALGSKSLGFIYLFIFGLGVGTPLLIIGTFSNAVNVVPRAGLWMVEVKKLFGIMLLSMCFYYLNAVMPWYTLLWLISCTLFIGGAWYIATIENYHSTGMRWYKQIFGFALLLAGCLVAYQAIKATFELPNMTQEEFHTATNYDDARERALQDNKYLIVDFGTAWCTSCKAIERKFFQDKQVHEALENQFIIVKIDCSNEKDESCMRTQEQFAHHIKGFPTLLVVKPQDQAILTSWGSELLGLSHDEFIDLARNSIK